MSTDPASHSEPRPTRLVVTGWVGVASVAVGYLLEAIRQRGDCEAGDASPDTLPVSVVLIVMVGGLAGVVGLIAAIVTGVRRGWSPATTVRAAMPAALSLAGALSIFFVAGQGPSTWFQYCAT